METHYSYAATLAAAEKINWRVEDIIGGDRGCALLILSYGIMNAEVATTNENEPRSCLSRAIGSISSKRSMQRAGYSITNLSGTIYSLPAVGWSVQ